MSAPLNVRPAKTVPHLHVERLVDGRGEVPRLVVLSGERANRAYRADGILRHRGGLGEGGLGLLGEEAESTTLPHRAGDEGRKRAHDHEGEPVARGEHEHETDDGGGGAAKEHGEVLGGDVLQQSGVGGEAGDERPAGDTVEKSNLLAKDVGEEAIAKAGNHLVRGGVEEVGSRSLEHATDETDREEAEERLVASRLASPARS